MDEEPPEEEIEVADTNPDRIVLNSSIYLVERQCFAYVKSQPEGNQYECIVKKASKDSKEV